MFCRNKNRFQYCIEQKPLMNADKVVKNFLLAMSKEHYYDAYRLLSISKKKKIGTISNFIKYSNNELDHFINSKKFSFCNKSSYDSEDIQYHRNVEIIDKDNLIYIYSFNLTRQYDWNNNKPLYDKYVNENLYMFWRIDNIFLKDIIESYSKKDINIDKKNLALCSKRPLTGFYRDGYCKTGKEDIGTHTVCAKVTDNFLKSQKKLGNDLITPSTVNNFPGLKDGDYWCLCANRYKQAKDNGINLEINRNATNIKTNQIISDFL